MFGIVGIILGLLLLVYLSYKGYSIIWVAPVSGLLVAIIGFGFDGRAILNSYLKGYMPALGAFAQSYFPLFFLGAVFGKLMEITGSANAVALILVRIVGAKRALLAVIISCGILTYGGVSLFVVVFAIYPLAISLFREANLPRRLIPGAIALGAFTFTMTAFPGAPQLNNIIAGQNFNTTPYAAPILGIIAGLIMFFGGYFYLLWKQNKIIKNGEHFSEPSVEVVLRDSNQLPSPILSIIPLIVVIISLYLFIKFVFKDLTPAEAVIPGSVLSLLCGIICTVIFNFNMLVGKSKDGKSSNGLIRALNEGGNGSVMAILNTAAAVGFGGVVKIVPGFKLLTDILLGMKASPLISEGIAITLLAGATGSSSGGMGIALTALAPQYLEMAKLSGLSPETLHRIATVASGGLDSLPHCGAVLTLLAVTGMTHKDSYNDIGMVTCILPIVALAAIIVLGTIGVV
ncbi:MAG: GntP family permease [Fusobacteriaceae bacterium]|jgi:H+/gluconate symporter-like permease|nr:GntP family permease [Fusobacteriaceae bacterium]